MKKSLLLVVCCVFGLVALAAGALDNCKGTVNTHPMITSPPTLIKSVANGKLYQVTDIEPPVNVVHLYGTGYQMGFAHGTLLKDQILSLYPEFFTWIEAQVYEYAHFLPKILQDEIDKLGVEAALFLEYELVKDYIPQHILDEVKGLSDATGLSFQKAMGFQLFPELIRAGCSMVGAWGPATKQVASGSGTLHQLRALDWNTNGPFQQVPTLFVYHPSQGDGNHFASLGWSGFIGGLTLYSQKVGVCEKVWLHYNGTYDPIGIPFDFELREIAQYANNIDDALNSIINARRTCSIFVGLGDAQTQQFKAVEYSYDRIAVFDDQNFETSDPVHEQFDGIVWVDKHSQPSHDPCLPSLLKEYYGQLDGPTIAKYVTSQFQTGDMHIGIFDFHQNLMFVSNASPFVNGTCTPAYDRPFIQFNMTELFSVTA